MKLGLTLRNTNKIICKLSLICCSEDANAKGNSKATIVIGPLRASSAVLPYTVLCTCSYRHYRGSARG